MTVAAPISPQDALEARSNLTHTQFMVWLGQKLAPGDPMYNMAWRIDLPFDVDAGAFRAAYENLVPRCDALRMVIEEEDGAPMQRDTGAAAGAFEVHDLGDADMVDAHIAAQIAVPFPLDRKTHDIALLRQGPGHWVLFLMQHHLTTDAASGPILLDDLSAAYQAVLAGEALPSEALPAFIDYAGAERAERNADDMAFWQETLRQRRAPPRLYGRVKGKSSKAARVTVPLGHERSEKLRALAKRDGFAMFSAHQSVFYIFATVLAAWTSRISAQEDVALGIMNGGRPTLDARRTVGHFAEIFPLDVSPDEQDSFRALHEQVTDQGFALFRHASPGACPAEGQARFNVVLNYIPAVFGTFAGQPVQAEWLHNGHTDPQHAIRMSVLDFAGDGEFLLSFHLNDEVFDPVLRDRVPGHILTLLDAFLADPDAALGAVPMAGAGEASVALTAPLPSPPPAPDLLAEVDRLAAEAPGQSAITDGDAAVTRAELAARADDIAGAMQAAGVAAGDRVGLYLRRSADLVASMLACLKLGAAFVPLDTSQPSGRLSRIAEGAELALVIEDRGGKGPWPFSGRTLDLARVATGQGAMPTAQTDPQSPAYLIFTSGSTGVPKGVAISRASLARYADWAARSFAKPQAAWPLHSAIGFDLTITSIFAPLISGGQIVVYPEPDEGTDLGVVDVFAEDRVDVVKLTPAHLRLVIEQGKPVSRISSLVLGGEALDRSLCAAAQGTLGPHVAIFNEYGPTEATVGCMLHRFDPARDRDASVPIGRPADHTAIYVLDSAGNPVPDRAVGELHIAGPDRLALGYHDNAEETAARFLPDPFNGGRMYKTGDLGSVDPDGTVLYHGRRDEQAKVSGVRVEPSEVRQAVMDHPGITGCAIRIGKVTSQVARRCTTCGLGADYPDADIDASGQCRLCRDFATYQSAAQAYFRTPEDFAPIIARAEARGTGKYACLMLLSGGKDSTYALGRLAESTGRVLAATLDNGFISDEAKQNIRDAVEALGVDHVFMQTPAMNEIFADSLRRHANVCNGCFKTIYTLALKLAREENIPLIVTGLSRGQLFETRLAPELFTGKAASPDDIDRTVFEARKTYHRVPDAASDRLNGDLFETDAIFDEVEFADFYRYHDVSVEEVYAYLGTRLPWIRPKDTGRSTNCLINDVGILYHRRTRGYHNYALPYSWDVRIGHKTRHEALDELDDDIDEGRVAEIMAEIGFDRAEMEAKAQRFDCYFTADEPISHAELRRHLADHLPREMIPREFVQVARIPLTVNGKVDFGDLPMPGSAVSTMEEGSGRQPATETERTLLSIWSRVLGVDDLGTDDNFYEAGGNSIAAIQIAAQGARAGFVFGAADVFRRQSVVSLASWLDAQSAAPTARKPAVRAAMSAADKARLGALFGNRPDG